MPRCRAGVWFSGELKVVVSMTQESAPCLLSVGLEVPDDGADGSYVFAGNAFRALELMKLLRFDLVVVAPGGVGMSIPHLVRQMRVIAPWQKWVLAANGNVSGGNEGGLTQQDELAARCNGALAVIDEVNDWSEVCALASGVRGRSRPPAALEA